MELCMVFKLLQFLSLSLLIAVVGAELEHQPPEFSNQGCDRFLHCQRQMAATYRNCVANRQPLSPANTTSTTHVSGGEVTETFGPNILCYRPFETEVTVLHQLVDRRLNSYAACIRRLLSGGGRRRGVVEGTSGAGGGSYDNGMGGSCSASQVDERPQNFSNFAVGKGKFSCWQDIFISHWQCAETRKCCPEARVCLRMLTSSPISKLIREKQTEVQHLMGECRRINGGIAALSRSNHELNLGPRRRSPTRRPNSHSFKTLSTMRNPLPSTRIVDSEPRTNYHAIPHAKGISSSSSANHPQKSQPLVPLKSVVFLPSMGWKRPAQSSLPSRGDDDRTSANLHSNADDERLLAKGIWPAEKHRPTFTEEIFAEPFAPPPLGILMPSASRKAVGHIPSEELKPTPLRQSFALPHHMNLTGVMMARPTLLILNTAGKRKALIAKRFIPADYPRSQLRWLAPEPVAENRLVPLSTPRPALRAHLHDNEVTAHRKQGVLDSDSSPFSHRLPIGRAVLKAPSPRVSVSQRKPLAPFENNHLPAAGAINDYDEDILGLVAVEQELSNIYNSGNSLSPRQAGQQLQTQPVGSYPHIPGIATGEPNYSPHFGSGTENEEEAGLTAVEQDLNNALGLGYGQETQQPFAKARSAGVPTLQALKIFEKKGRHDGSVGASKSLSHLAMLREIRRQQPLGSEPSSSKNAPVEGGPLAEHNSEGADPFDRHPKTVVPTLERFAQPLTTPLPIATTTTMHPSRRLLRRLIVASKAKGEYMKMKRRPASSMRTPKSPNMVVVVNRDTQEEPQPTTTLSPSLEEESGRTPKLKIFKLDKAEDGEHSPEANEPMLNESNPQPEIRRSPKYEAAFFHKGEEATVEKDLLLNLEEFMRRKNIAIPPSQPSLDAPPSTTRMGIHVGITANNKQPSSTKNEKPQEERNSTCDVYFGCVDELIDAGAKCNLANITESMANRRLWHSSLKARGVDLSQPRCRLQLAYHARLIEWVQAELERSVHSCVMAAQAATPQGNNGADGCIGAGWSLDQPNEVSTQGDVCAPQRLLAKKETCERIGTCCAPLERCRRAIMHESALARRLRLEHERMERRIRVCGGEKQ